MYLVVCEFESECELWLYVRSMFSTVREGR